MTATLGSSDLVIPLPTLVIPGGGSDITEDTFTLWTVPASTAAVVKSVYLQVDWANPGLGQGAIFELQLADVSGVILTRQVTPDLFVATAINRARLTWSMSANDTAQLAAAVGATADPFGGTQVWTNLPLPPNVLAPSSLVNLVAYRFSDSATQACTITAGAVSYTPAGVVTQEALVPPNINGAYLPASDAGAV